MSDYLASFPTAFKIAYSINPWMHPEEWKPEMHEDAEAQHRAMCKTIAAAGGNVYFGEPMPHLPDMVYTANAGLVLDKKVLISRMKFQQRKDESHHFSDWFRKNTTYPVKFAEVKQSETIFEGAGDALYDRDSGVIFMGFGFRTRVDSKHELAEYFGRGVVPLRLRDDRFYHLDTCFCPLPDNHLLVYSKAIENKDYEECFRRIIYVSEEDAVKFTCNSVVVGRTLVTSMISDELTRQIEDTGLKVERLPTSAFIMGGGSIKCLTLRLDE